MTNPLWVEHGEYLTLMMGRFKIYYIPLTFLLASFACAVDRTRENGASGSAVVEAVVDLLRARCILSDDNFFLRRMAYATSNDGEDSDTYRVGFDGGIWQVCLVNCFQSVQNIMIFSIFIETIS